MNRRATKDHSSDTGSRSISSRIPHFLEHVLARRSVYIALGIILLVAITNYGVFLFGDQLFLFKDIGSDTINIFYPNLYLIDRMLSEGLPAWSFHQGMGQNIFPLSTGDPFNWMVFLLYDSEDLASGIALIETIKVVTGGLFFYAFLRTRNLDSFTSLIGGVIYSASGYMMVGTGWYIFTTEAALAAFLLWSFERLLVHRKWLMFPVAIMFIAAVQPVVVFVLSVLLGLYGVVRLLEHHDYDVRASLLILAKITGLGALGIGLSGLWLLPAVHQMLNSPRVLGESTFFSALAGQSIFATVDATQGLTILGRFFANDFLGAAGQFTGWNNYLEAPMHYSGLATLLLVPQALCLMSRRQRILYGSLLTIVLVPLIFPFFRHAVWLFSGNYYRLYSLIVIVALLIVALRGLHLIHTRNSVNFFALGASLTTALFLVYVPFSLGDASRVNVNATIQWQVSCFLVIYSFLIASLKYNRLRFLAQCVFLVVIFAELVNLSGSSINDRDTIAKEGFGQNSYYNDYSVDAMQFINSVDQTPFYRVSKTYSSGGAMHASLNDAKVQGYYGTRSYHSFHHPHYIGFLGAVGLIDPTVESQTRWTPGLGSRQLLNVMASNKYILSKSDQEWVGHGYTPVHTVGDVTVHQNQNFVPFGFTYSRILPRSAFDSLGWLEKDISLINAAVIADEDMPFFSSLDEFDSVSIASNYTPEMLAKDARELAAVSLNIRAFSNGDISGDIVADRDRVLFFSMPLDRGWKATMNGRDAVLFNVNAGLTGLFLPAGEHKVVLSYSVPYLQEGLWLSSISFMLFGGVIWRSRGRRKPMETAPPVLSESGKRH